MQDLRVTGLQYDIVWKNKTENFLKLEKEFENISETDIVVLPEMFQTGFCFDVDVLAEPYRNSETIEWMATWAAKLQVAIVGSLIIEEGSKFYNRLIWMNPDKTFFKYDKRHLFSMSEEPTHFEMGSEKLIVSYKGWTICPMICYDLRFPVWIRNTEQYDLLLFIANWPQRRSVHWEKLLEARAIENQCYVLGVNRVGTDGTGIYHDGKSAIISPLGDKIDSQENIEIKLESALKKDVLNSVRLKMPFLKDADAFSISEKV